MLQDLTLDDLLLAGHDVVPLGELPDGKPLMQGRFQHREMMPGLWGTSTSCTSLASFSVTEETEEHFSFSVCLEGERRFRLGKSDDKTFLPGSLSAIVAPSGGTAIEHWQKGQHTETAGIVFDSQFLRHIEDEDEEIAEAIHSIGQRHQLADGKTAPSNLLLLARQFSDPPGYGQLNALYNRGLSLAFLAAAVALYRIHETEKPHSNHRLETCISDLRNRLLLEPFKLPDLSELAKNSGFSERRVRSAFYGRYGITVGNFLRIQRLERALDMLESGHLSLASIAHECGYSNTANFSNAFKKRFGLTPGSVRTN
ncbi:MAG: helix-turn-helix domain-containing protein [Pseudomonadota bacterium]